MIYILEFGSEYYGLGDGINEKMNLNLEKVIVQPLATFEIWKQENCFQSWDNWVCQVFKNNKCSLKVIYHIYEVRV